MAEVPFSLRFTSAGVTTVRGRATVTAEALILDAVDPPGPSRSLDYSDIETVSIGQWELDFSLFEGTVYHFSHLAERFDPFVAAFTAARNERWIRGLLYRDQVVEREFEGEIEHEDRGRVIRDKATIRLYPASLVALCATTDPLSVSYNDVSKVEFDPGAYALRVSLADGALISLYKLGDRFDELSSILDRLRRDLVARVATQLRDLAPAIGEAGSLRLAGVVGHGRAFMLAEAEAAAPGSWAPLAQAVLGTDELRASFTHLADAVSPDHVYLGLITDATAESPDSVATPAPDPAPTPSPSSAAAADATSPVDAGKPTYTSWFLIARPDAGKLAFEVTSEPDHATYVFRLDGSDVATDVRRVSRALVALNFAREPIYLPLDQLETGTRRRYQLALRKLPYLADLRDRFVGRAIHNDTWQQQVDGLLSH